MEFRKRDPDQIWVWEITYGFSLNRGRGGEAIETDVSVIGVMTSLWCALLPTQASEVAAQIWEVQLFCRSNFKKAWEVHLYADLTETLKLCIDLGDTADSEFNGVIEKWTVSLLVIHVFLNRFGTLWNRVVCWWIVMFGWENELGLSSYLAGTLWTRGYMFNYKERGSGVREHGKRAVQRICPKLRKWKLVVKWLRWGIYGSIVHIFLLYYMSYIM